MNGYDRQHYIELAEQARQFESPVFTDFLDLQELRIIRRLSQSFDDIHIKEFVCFADDERRMVGFIPASYGFYMTEEDLMGLFPVVCLSITYDERGAKQPFNHRDVLGTVLGMGFDRRLTGDILFYEQGCYILVHERIAPMICQELISIRHTPVSVDPVVDRTALKTLEPAYERIRTTVASLRLDNIMKAACGKSRTICKPLIDNGHVKVNQQPMTKSHAIIEEGDRISIRGYGKYRLKEIGDMSRKDRIFVEIYKYI